jgi:hypothetical protein
MATLSLSYDNTYIVSGNTASAIHVWTDLSDIQTWANGNINTDNLATLTGTITHTVSTAINAYNLTNSSTQIGLYINQSGVLAASKYGQYIYSNAAQVNSSLWRVQMNNASSTAAVGQIYNAGSGNFLEFIVA